ncbi:PREDICTED: pentatricopeptide repeat-containing protein At5g16860 [Nelumbo nucifera]|uniref:Pentatricopeptide repeat-containing protein At5g16860 n=1 Tax=Nelumbo nucifera TaxID=4432 RepID=A0A1U8A8H3_NELNU|nr:PREDICTED: pentatricopeptide repeat-containing protein At5g16860 [Nelumbo nucifera]
MMLLYPVKLQRRQQRPGLNRCFIRNILSGASTSAPTLASLLKECNSLSDAQLIHQQILVRGLTDIDVSRDIIRVYIACDAPIPALSVLQRLPPSDPFWWNALIRRDVRLGFLDHALHLFRRMLRLGWKPDQYTYPFVIKACGDLPSFRRGAALHAFVCGNGFESNVFVCNALVAMYSRCGALEEARQVFDEVTQREIDDVVSWNSIVTAYVQGSDPTKALEMFTRMPQDVKLRPDAVSLVNILKACASVGAPMQGKQAHGFSLRVDHFGDVFVGNAVVDMYAKCGMMGKAKMVFERMEIKDVVSWNAMVTGYAQSGSFADALHLFEKMRKEKIELNVVTWSAVISGYAQRGRGYEALDVFRQMLLSGSVPNVVTLSSLLSGCAAVGALRQGKETHGYAIRCVLNRDDNDPGDDLMVNNALIDMYVKCKDAKDAHAIFESISPQERNVVTWTVMIGGYAQHGDANDALKLFTVMLSGANAMVPNAFTISCSLVACARLGALRSGKQIHAYVIRNRYESVMLFVANCLIEMYSKSGDIDAARCVFDHMNQRNAVSWTSLMTGYGMHGQGEEALKIFHRMQEAGLVPDGVTFLVVLYACSHAGMVDQGIQYFNRMGRDYNVAAGAEHYACMVDLLGRAGRLDEAMELIKGMPMEPTPIVWVALLSACRIHANVELAEFATGRLHELESDNDGSYTLLSNIYANAGRWKDVARIRSLMKKTGIKKRPGCSWVQGKNGIATFYVGDRSHPESQQIYEVLADMIRRIKDMGYVPETSFALHDVDDEEKGDLLMEHSEKLALAYAILTSAPGAPIRITKNLRVCGDCHSAMTFISRVVEHEIIVRDSSRFHHFKNGSCSCKGYW